jgi:hypothetical protein
MGRGEWGENERSFILKFFSKYESRFIFFKNMNGGSFFRFVG